MPLYDYRCKECSHEVEVMHGIYGVGPTTCEVCGGVMRKAMSTPAIHFKGSGWAKKDAQAATKAKAAKPDDGSATTGGDKAGDENATKGGGKADSSSKSTDGDAAAKTSTGKDAKGPAPTKDASKSTGTTTAKATSKAAD